MYDEKHLNQAGIWKESGSLRVPAGFPLFPGSPGDKVVEALKTLVPRTKFASRPVPRTRDVYEVVLVDKDLTGEEFKGNMAVYQALEDVNTQYGVNSNYAHKGVRERWNGEWAAAIEAVPQEGRGNFFTFKLVKRAMTQDISLYGYTGQTRTHTWPNQLPFTEIHWDWRMPAPTPNNPNTTVELAHEFVHHVSGIAGGAGVNEQRVCAFENMVRFEQKMEMRQKYLPDGPWIAGGQYPLINARLED
jgi:hypothetical protein